MTRRPRILPERQELCFCHVPGTGSIMFLPECFCFLNKSPSDRQTPELGGAPGRGRQPSHITWASVKQKQTELWKCCVVRNFPDHRRTTRQPKGIRLCSLCHLMSLVHYPACPSQCLLLTCSVAQAADAYQPTWHKRHRVQASLGSARGPSPLCV